MIDISLLRLQYEILNAPVEQLAQEAGCSPKMIRMEIENGNWKQLLPDLPPVVDPLEDPDASECSAFETETNAFIENNRRRLKAYSLAKELMLASRYLALEISIIDKATALVDSVQTAAEAKLLAALYKDLTSNSNLANLATLALSKDDNGLPTFIMRDLSGPA